MSQNQNQSQSRKRKGAYLYEVVPWVVYLSAHKLHFGGINYRPVHARRGPGLYYDLRTGHEVLLSDGTRKGLAPEQAHEVARRIADQTPDGPIDRWVGTGTARLTDGSLAIMRSEPDRRAYLVAGAEYSTRATPRPARPDQVASSVPDGQALEPILGTPVITYDLHQATVLVRAMRVAGMDAELYSMPLRTIRYVAQSAPCDYLHKPYIADCQAYTLGIVPLGDHWMLPTYALPPAVAQHVGLERIEVP